MLFGSLVDLQKIWDETFDNFLSVHIHLSLRCYIFLDNANATLSSGFECCMQIFTFPVSEPRDKGGHTEGRDLD